MLHGVAEQVGQQLPNARPIAHAGEIALQLAANRSTGIGGSDFLHDLLTDRRKISLDAQQRHSAAQPGGGEVHQVPGETRDGIGAGANL